MDLGQAIATLLQQETPAPTAPPILTVLSEILHRSIGESVADSGDSDRIFAQLDELARSGRQEIFVELIKAEQQRAETSEPTSEPTILMSAVMAKKVEVVKALLSAGADVHAKYQQFLEFNALQLAVDDNHIELVRILLDAGADPNWMNGSPGLTPIVKAIKHQNYELLKLLIHHSAAVKFATGVQLLVEATQYNNVDIVQVLIDSGCDVNAEDYRKITPLGQSCTSCHPEVIQTLLAAGAELSPVGADLLAIFGAPFMAKQLAGLLGEQSDPKPRMPIAIQLFIDAGANLDVQGGGGMTALSLAIADGDLKIAKMLLDGGANPNLPGKLTPMFWIQNSDRKEFFRNYSHEMSPLNLATALGNLELVQLLIDRGADVTLRDEKEQSAIDIAVKEGHQSIVQYLQNSGAIATSEATQCSPDALLGAAKTGNLEVLRSALSAGIDPNSSQASSGRHQYWKTVLMFAAEAGHLEAVNALLAAGADVNLSDRPGKKLGKTPLMVAAENDQADVLRAFLEAGAIVDAQDKRGQTALFYAVEEDAADAVEVLLEFGADPHKKSWEGTPFEQATYQSDRITKLMMAADQKKSTPVSHAAREEMLRSAVFDGNAELVRDLIQQGVDVNAAARDGGWTALLYGAAQGHLTVVQLLLAAGADVNQASTSGQTPITESAYWGRSVDVVTLLLSAGANLNQHGDGGYTPVMKTVTWGAQAILQLLIEAGADLTLRNEQGQTALAIAIEFERHAIADQLRKAGAK